MTENNIQSSLSKMNPRTRRNTMINPTSARPLGDPKSGKNRFTGDLLPGEYGKDGRIVLNTDGSVTFSNKVFFDDILAFVSFGIESNPDPTMTPIKNSLRKVVEDADARAFTKHQYADSIEERDAGWINYST